MKANIVFLLVKYFLCFQMVYLKSFSSFVSETNITTYHLDISDYEQNDVMHLCIIVMVGEINKLISYGFSDETSITSNLLKYTIDTTSSESFTKKGKSSKTHSTTYTEGMKYYYDIEKVENAKYLLIQCTGYTGVSIEYEFMPMSAIGFYILFGVLFVVCYAGIFIYIYWSAPNQYIPSTKRTLSINKIK